MQKSLKVLSISSDRKLFEEGSSVSERISEYGKLVRELHIVVLAKKSLGLKDKQIAPNVWVYSSNSSSRWLYIRDASKLGKKIVFEKKFVRGEALITAQDPFENGRVGLKVKKKWRLPLEVQLHTDPFSPYFGGFLNGIRKIIARNVLRNADGVRVVTEGLKQKIAGMTSAEIRVLPIYVDKEKIEAGQVAFDLHARYPWRFILLVVARLAPEKNLKMVLEVLAGVRKFFPDTGLVIVGSGTEERSLRSLTKKLMLEGAVEFVGWQNDLTSFYKTANVFIQTSFYEGYGLSLVEAGLLGLPIISTPVGLAKELESGKEAYIFSIDEPDMFVNGIIDLIEDNYKRENLRINMKQFLDKKLISKDEYMAQIKDGWEKVANRIQVK